MNKIIIAALAVCIAGIAASLMLARTGSRMENYASAYKYGAPAQRPVHGIVRLQDTLKNKLPDTLKDKLSRPPDAEKRFREETLGSKNGHIEALTTMSVPAGTDDAALPELADRIVENSGMYVSRYNSCLDSYKLKQKRREIPPDPSRTVKLGRYPQNGNTPEPIEWIVLAEFRGRLFVISKYVLERRVFDESDKNVKWRDCSLRKWLNGDFYDKAFSPEEKKRIAVSRVTCVDREADMKGPMETTVTEDKIFIPTKHETEIFFYEDRTCKATPHARDGKLLVHPEQGFSPWWLRGRTVGPSMAYQILGYTFEKPNTDFVGVRPMMWITAK